ncbi:MAG: hypothetical protein ACON41_04770 [Parvibaculales bacterium]
MAKKKPPLKTESKPDSEIMPPETGGDETNIYAIIQNFSSNPEKMLGMLEQYDPGFIKRFNEKSEAFADKSRERRFRFLQTQAYTSLGIRVICTLAALFILYNAVSADANFLTLIAIILLIILINGGLPVWQQIGEAIAERIKK